MAYILLLREQENDNIEIALDDNNFRFTRISRARMHRNSIKPIVDSGGFYHTPLGKQPKTITVRGKYFPSGIDIASAGLSVAPGIHWYKRLVDIEDITGQVFDIDFMNIEEGSYFFKSFQHDADKYTRMYASDRFANEEPLGSVPIEVMWVMEFIEINAEVSINRPPSSDFILRPIDGNFII